MAATCATNTVEMMGDISGRPAHSVAMMPTMDGNSVPPPTLDVPASQSGFVFPASPVSPSAAKPFPRAGGRRSKSVMDPPGQAFDLASGPSRTSRTPMALPDFKFNPGAETNSSKPRTSALPDFKFNPGASIDSAEPRSRPEALPEFSFNPGAASDPQSMLSPPLSPRTIPSRGGHRRFGSEFVGGKIRSGDSITVMSTSPTKSESGFASPLLGPTPGPSLAPSDAARRRGHSHKRSGAISSHDLSMILKPKSPNVPLPKGSSAPTSPSEPENGPKPFPEVIINSPSPAVSPIALQPQPIPEPIRAPPQVPQPASAAIEAEDDRPTPRARVGFSDTLEYIPRPLSLVSTDTTSTATTRPSHSVSNSISSIISMSNIPSDRGVSSRGNPELREQSKSSAQNDSRPSTAGAVLERTPSTHVHHNENPSPRRRNSIPVLKIVPESAADSEPLPSPSRTPKRWSFFGLDPFGGHSPPTKTRPVSAYSTGAISSIALSEYSGSDANALANLRSGELKPCGKPLGKKKKQKRVKSWAGSILTRTTKSRARSKKSARRRSMTPPVPRSTMDDDMEDDSNDDEVDPISASAPTITFSEPTKPSRQPRALDEDVSFPMIDLDAALGPFNTPSTLDASWDAAQRGGIQPKRQLHSAAGMRNFTGPGMHYHRRAESAPALPPFEAGRFGIPRFGSSSTMADVFEEDEEEEEGPRPASERSSSVSSEARETRNNSVARSEDLQTTPTREGDAIGAPLAACSTGESSPSGSVKRKGSGSSLDLQPPGSRIRTEASTNSLHGSVIVEEELSPVTRENFPGSPDVLGSAPPSHFRAAAHRDLASLDVNPLDCAPSTATASPYSMSHASSFPSPRTPVSYDAHRISTAPSSIADEHNFQSLLMGEPGPEVVRMSVDVPSLTSTTSTMTRESMFAAIPRPRNAPFHDQRPASFTSTAFGRRRSSLASLSRLISSAHGERSKLSMEVPCEEEPEKKTRGSKSKRLSRMMQFWKTKEPKEC